MKNHKTMLFTSIFTLLIGICIVTPVESSGNTIAISAETEMCLVCHDDVTPGIVSDWRNSLHSKTTVNIALGKPEINRKLSIDSAPDNLGEFVIGCAECHSMNNDSHTDSFEHNGSDIHVVVSPDDCAVCHPVERQQYSENIMANAYGNLVNNPVYFDLVSQSLNFSHFQLQSEKDLTFAAACLYCHGTIIEVDGTVTRDTTMGTMDFPNLKGWPNQGVGRINPDGSMGACTSCHPRHEFSLKTARSPQACAECHTGPDVPAYKVYKASKHGNIYESVNDKWNFDNVPWVVGEDFTAPTCATCHVSELAKPNGDVIINRTHKMNDRLANRLFGPIFAIPHPIDADTTKIVSPAGLPIPADLDAKLASEFLVDPDEQNVRDKRMKSVCLNCHAGEWVDGHFELLDNTMTTTNNIILESNLLMLEAWDKGYAKGLDAGDSIFNEYIEKAWVEQWLFHANSIRFASAMGGADYGVFANGRWQMSKALQQMKEWLESKSEE